MSTMVSVNSLSMSYKRGKTDVEVLHDLSLTVPKGEFLALMGPSGSGKTTLLNILGGLDRPTRGEVTVGGQRIDQLSGGALARWRSQHVGFIFQFYNLMPTLSAQKNVELPLLLTNLSASRRRQNASAALELVGLSQRSSHKPSELSGGQQQRVAIARAIVADPELLICDEPTGDLDRETGDEILEVLRTLCRQQQKTVIMVTHDMKAAAAADRVLGLDKGALVRPVRELAA